MYAHTYVDVCALMRRYVPVAMYVLRVQWVGLRMYSMHVCMYMSVIHPHVHAHWYILQ